METVKKGLVNGSKARWYPTEFYMRRDDKAYFRNKFGKIFITECSNKELNALIYGKKYQFRVSKLIRNEND